MSLETAAAVLAESLRSNLDARLGTTGPGHAWAVFTPAGPFASGAGGTAAEDGTPATVGTAFRIASCTKSFTAALALQLRDEERLHLDDSIDRLLPYPVRFELGGAAVPAPTVRQLLSMSGGLPTDDPWGDRQESIDQAGFAALCADGLRLCRRPGDGYEYANLGYALVGEALGVIGGAPYRRLVRERLLEPLGLGATRFVLDELAVPAATGFRRGPEGWTPLPFSGPGVFSSIGGLFSTVADLARWAGWLAEAWSARPADGVLSAASRRELQQPRVPIGAVDGGGVESYGFGTVVRQSAGRRVVSHSGGYPGFSAHLRWDADSGLGAVAFENGTYSRVIGAVQPALDEALAELPVVRDAPWPEVAEAMALVEAMVRDGRIVPHPMFAENLVLDAPFEERTARLRAVLDAVGPLGDAGSRDPSGTAASATWSIAGERGSIRIRLQLTAHRGPRIQTIGLDLAED